MIVPGEASESDENDDHILQLSSSSSAPAAGVSNSGSSSQLTQLVNEGLERAVELDGDEGEEASTRSVPAVFIY